MFLHKSCHRIIQIYLSVLVLFQGVFFKVALSESNYPSKIANKLSQKFFESNINTNSLSSFNASLARFQYDLLKSRNNECVDKEGLVLSDFLGIKLNDSELNKTLISLENFYLNMNEIPKSFDEMCIGSSSLVRLFTEYNKNNDYANKTNFNYESLFEIVLTQLTNKGCDLCIEEPVSLKVTPLETWGYGLLFVTIISMSSLCGALVIPLSNKKIYKKTLMIMIGIAVGSLAGSGFLHLIPQAFGIADDPKYSTNHDYVWKGLVMMAGVYLFYIVEKILKLLILRKKIKRSASQTKQLQDENQNQILESIGYVKTHEKILEPNVEMRMHLNDKVLAYNITKNSQINKDNHGHSHNLEGLQTVAPVAWMIIFGDSLHNFIDGLSIGAAFTESIMKGVSICLAVICEEFPHELGDFAILLNAGMSWRAALFFNFMSACSCYAGLAVGIILGDNFEANKWIYAIAGGMFLYISLCDMVPELNEMGEEIERDYIIGKRQILYDKGEIAAEEEINLDSNSLSVSYETFDLNIKLKVLLMQNLGIVLGFSIMLIMALKSDGLIPAE